MKHATQEKRKGFTLAELLIVVAIIAVLVTIAIPVFGNALDKANGAVSLVNARQAYLASSLGFSEWISAGSPGNGDKAFKINIENEIIASMDMGPMTSFTATNSAENTVQVALSLPSYFDQGWLKFKNECQTNKYKNFVRVWIGKDPDKTVGDTIKAVYYVSADGKYAARIVYDETTKLGSVEQRTGSYYERIDKAGS